MIKILNGTAFYCHRTPKWMIVTNISICHGKCVILSWSWLNIWFEPMRWLVLGHVTGINSATTTCQPWPANHDLCFLGFWTNQKEILNASICIKMKRLESYWYGNSYFMNILDKKTIQNGIFSIGWHLISSKNFYCCVLLKFKKQCWKCT